MTKNNNIGILGGTFNPIHNGHIKLALEFKRELSLDRVFFVPAAIPPHKNCKDTLNSDVRLKMCSIALKDFPYFFVCDIETSRKGVSFTYLTLEFFKKEFESSRLFFIMGADMFLTVQTWKNSKKIFEMSTICAAPRGDCTIDKLNRHAQLLNFMGAKTYVFDAPAYNVSSTDIREKIISRQSISGFVPKDLEDYILKNKLYLDSSPTNFLFMP